MNVLDGVMPPITTSPGMASMHTTGVDDPVISVPKTVPYPPRVVPLFIITEADSPEGSKERIGEKGTNISGSPVSMSSLSATQIGTVESIQTPISGTSSLWSRNSVRSSTSRGRRGSDSMLYLQPSKAVSG